MRIPRILIAVLMTSTFACGPSKEATEAKVVEDIVKAAPERAKLLLDNEHVSVILFNVPAQAELPMHEGLDRVVYSLSDYRLQYRTQYGEPATRISRRGEVHWHSAGAHTVKNVGPIRAEYLVVSRKKPNPTPGVTSNLAELAPEKARVIFENQDAKVIEVTLNAGEKQPPHKAAARVVYSLTPAKLKFAAGSQTSDDEHAAGDVHYHEGGEHRVTNVSKETVRYLVFELM